MKRSWKLSLGILFILAWIVSACSSYESGVLLILEPTAGQNFYDEYNGNILPVTVVVKSSFEASKPVSVLFEGQEVAKCLVGPLAEEQVCASVDLPAPGEYSITVRTWRNGGEVVESSTYVQWTPYTALDRAMWYLSWSQTPVGGYLVVYLALMTLLVIGVWFVVRDEHLAATVVALATGVLMVVMFFLPSAGQAYWAACWLVPFFVVSIVLASWWKHSPLRPPLILTRDDGSQIRYQTRERRKPDKPVRAEMRDVGSDLDVSARSPNEEA